MYLMFGFHSSEQIVDIVEKNRVVVIKGATGSGKTTRVPQFLLDHYIKQLRGAECNIAVTQPRRISATSLATRIAAERNENVSNSLMIMFCFEVLEIIEDFFV